MSRHRTRQRGSKRFLAGTAARATSLRRPVGPIPECQIGPGAGRNRTRAPIAATPRRLAYVSFFVTDFSVSRRAASQPVLTRRGERNTENEGRGFTRATGESFFRVRVMRVG